MSNDWFTLRYSCSARPPARTFAIEPELGGKGVDYDFQVDRNQVFSGHGTCIAMQAISNQPVTEIHFSEGTKNGRIFRGSATIRLPDRFKRPPKIGESSIRIA